MLWIAGVAPLHLTQAYLASATALLVFGFFAAKQQHAYSPIIKNANAHTHVDWGRLSVVAILLMFTVGTNVLVNVYAPHSAEAYPWIGAALWLGLFCTSAIRRHDWELVKPTAVSSVFLLLLVLSASLLPVDALPIASWQSTLGIGFVSALLNNIPLTALAIQQGGYDWPLLAYAVGFGGSLLWFGSSAGVAVVSMFPEGRNTAQWLKQGWHVLLAFVVSFFVMLAITGWHPQSL
jgi:uncharacterized membrane protein